MFLLISIGVMLPMTRLLQTKGLDLVLAMSGVADLLSVLRSMRSADHFSQLFKEATAVADLLDIPLIKPRVCGRSVYRAAAAIEGAKDSVETFYRLNVYYPTLDNIVQDCNLRFGPKQQQAIELSRVIPAFMSFGNEEEERLHWNQIQAAISVYSNLFIEPCSVIKGEYELWRRKWERVDASERPRSAVATLNQCDSVLFSNISLILQLLSTLPVTTAEAERMFSKLERTLTAIRTTMEETRLEALLLLQIHRSDTPAIDDVINRFATLHARRLKFML